MISFQNDYSEGALPEVLEALVRTNMDITPGYSTDAHCAAAASKIKQRFACAHADVHFLVGGTQTNFTAISAFLRPWEAVIAPASAHIAAHETGSVEATGHKIIEMPTPDGKLTPDLIRAAYTAHENGKNEHMVLPKLVYISNSTEYGTIYQRAELAAISTICRELGLYLYLDGARMGAALSCDKNDLAPEDFAQFCDAFYIGGTKNGLLFGEVLVILNDTLKPNFRFAIKQRGGMLAKGRLLGVQFSAMLENDLWLTAARHSNVLASKLSEGLRSAGYTLYVDSPTNQVFPVFTKAQYDSLSENFLMTYMETLDEGRILARLVTSWATSEASVDAFLAAI